MSATAADAMMAGPKRNAKVADALSRSRQRTVKGAVRSQPGSHSHISGWLRSAKSISSSKRSGCGSGLKDDKRASARATPS